MSIEDQIHIIGRILGWIIFSGFVWAVLNYFVKLINRKHFSNLPLESRSRRRYNGFLRTVTKSHRYVPMFIVTVMFIHLMMELIHEGFFITGVITFCLMFTQIAIGIYGAYRKDGKRGPWFYIHRTNAALLGAAIVAHVASVIILKP